MPTPPLAEGTDLTAPDGVIRFRQQLIADVDELLREHHSRIAQHVEESMAELSARLVKQPHNFSTLIPDATKGQIRRLMPSGNGRRSGAGSRFSWRSSTGASRQEGDTSVQGRGSKVSSHHHRLGEGLCAKDSMVGGRDLLDRKLHAECCGACTSAEPEEEAEEGKEANAVEVGGDGASAKPSGARNDTAMARLHERVQCFRTYSAEMKEKWKHAVAKSKLFATSPEECQVSKRVSLDRRSIRRRARGIVESAAFEIITCILIATNAVFSGIETQLMVMGNAQGCFDYIALVYTGVFTCELILRFLAAGREFYVNEHRLWNAVDTIVVLMALLEAAFQAADADGRTNLTSARVIRVARVVRILRVARMFRAFASLRILMYCVLNTLRSLVWTMVFLLGILYIFGIVFARAAWEVLALGRGHLTDPGDQQNYDALTRHFGSLPRAIFTLFKAVTDGMDWQDVSTPLGWVHPFWEFLFTVFISFTYFAVMNVITGVFCQTAIESAANDRDMVVQAQLSNKRIYTEQLRELFQRIDANSCGQVDFVMLEACLKDPQCQAYFEALGVTPDDAWNLFKLLDDDDSCQIELEEFVSGCLRLRGNSRSIDSHMLLYESRWTMRKVGGLLDAFGGLVEVLSSLDSEKPPLTAQEPIAADSLAPIYERASDRESAHRREAPSGESTADRPGSGGQKEHRKPVGKPAGDRGSRRHEGDTLEEDSRSAELIGDLSGSSVAKL